MFIGHYAVGLALKSVEKKASLGMLFIAVQFVDFLFFILVPLGVEKFRLVENYTAINHFDLYFYPYTHGLLAGVIWAVLIYGLWRYIPPFKTVGNGRVPLVMALAVLSHWFVDLIVIRRICRYLGTIVQRLVLAYGIILWGLYCWRSPC